MDTTARRPGRVRAARARGAMASRGSATSAVGIARSLQHGNVAMALTRISAGLELDDIERRALVTMSHELTEMADWARNTHEPAASRARRRERFAFRDSPMAPASVREPALFSEGDVQLANYLDDLSAKLLELAHSEHPKPERAADIRDIFRSVAQDLSSEYSVSRCL